MERPGEHKLKHLFRPGTLGRFETKNQVKYGACCVSNYNTRDGFITPRELARVRVIAGTGCGIITNQGAYPDPLGEGKAYFRQVAIFDDKFLPQFETIAQYIHDAALGDFTLKASKEFLPCGLSLRRSRASASSGCVASMNAASCERSTA